MTASNFEPCMLKVKISEGGYVNHKKDPGGETNYGISKRSYPREDIRGLTWDRAKAIYRRDFWDKVKGDQLPSGVDYVVLDPAINSGCSRAVKFLQVAVGSPVDGVLGAKTLVAVQARPPIEIIQAVSKARLGFMQSLNIWSTFKNGWSRRVAEVEAISVKMAGGTAAQMTTIANTATATAKANAQKSVATATGGGATVTLTDAPSWAIAVLVVSLGLVVVYLSSRRAIELERATAFNKESNNV